MRQSAYTRLIKPRHSGAVPALRLLAFGFAGGSITALLPLFRHLDPAIEIWGAEYPGRGLRGHEPAYQSSEALLDDLARGLEALTQTPFAVLGYSMGAALACRLIERCDLRPQGAVILSARARRRNDDVLGLADAGDDTLLERTCALGGIPDAVLKVPEILDPFLHSLRADLACCRSLGDTTSLPCPVLMLRGNHDPLVSGEDQRAWLNKSQRVAGNLKRSYAAGHFLHHGREPEVAHDISQWLLQRIAEPSAVWRQNGPGHESTMSFTGSTP